MREKTKEGKAGQKPRKIRRKELAENIRRHKGLFLLYTVLRALVILVMIAQILNRNYENVFLCVLTLLLFTLPSAVEIRMEIDIPAGMQAIILLFIFAAEILGEINKYYLIFPEWDTMLHTLNGFLAAAIGFALVDLLNRSERFSFKLSPLFVVLVAFCFSMTIGVFWEFFEYFMDISFGLDMQKDTVIHRISSVMLNSTGANRPEAIRNITSTAVNGQELGLGGYLDIGLIDTMGDLFVNFIGAVTFSVIGYGYLKYQGRRNRIVRELIPTWRGEEELTVQEKEPAGGEDADGK
ncbi:MAG TPA: hypothetical protein IAB71_02655 [Candidatus Scatomonas pullistercoris]|uniref:Uncharacterized protein n=1 Tax=Candidatus Scatomonas pullistercoris TaxID=2840920 RepID=A0A9D1P2F1_9FIRM|nr:hypothetical protein [Candidatus Scatomonas pullistercoris]